MGLQGDSLARHLWPGFKIISENSADSVDTASAMLSFSSMASVTPAGWSSIWSAVSDLSGYASSTAVDGNSVSLSCSTYTKNEFCALDLFKITIENQWNGIMASNHTCIGWIPDFFTEPDNAETADFGSSTHAGVIYQTDEVQALIAWT